MTYRKKGCTLLNQDNLLYPIKKYTFGRCSISWHQLIFVYSRLNERKANQIRILVLYNKANPLLYLFLLTCLILVIFQVALGSITVFPSPRTMIHGKTSRVIQGCGIVFTGITHNKLQDIVDTHRELFTIPKCEGDTTKGYFLEVIYPSEMSNNCFDESYSLLLFPKSGKISVRCGMGLVRALTTLNQLLIKQVGEWSIEGLPILIEDKPRFEYRGLLIDTARHYLKIDTIKKVIQSMMHAKLNVLHWHIVDDDSFPLVSETFPDFIKYTAFDSKSVYTKADIQEIIDYAEKRGVRILPEFDTPGHSRIVGFYPKFKDIVAGFNLFHPYDVQDVYKIQGGPPSASLDPSMEKSYEYTKGILKDVLKYFKDTLIHLGGDEVYDKCWDERPAIREFMKKHGIIDYQGLQSYWINKIHAMLAELDSSRVPIYWSNEGTFKVKYNSKDIIQYWGRSTNINKLHVFYPNNKVILSPFDYYYLDLGHGNPFGGNYGIFSTFIHMHVFEPTDHGLPESQIYGGEACLWGELVNDYNIHSKIWPRTLAMAETLWAPKRSFTNITTIVSSLNKLSETLNSLDISTKAITGHYCEMDPYYCFHKY